MRAVDQIIDQGVMWNVPAESWQELTLGVGQRLIELGLCDERYPDALVQNVVTNGPYLVIAPGLALLHARPDEGATTNGLVMGTSAHPIEFGHSTNDPVTLFIGLTATGDMEHLDMLQEVAQMLAAPGALDGLRSATSESDFVAKLRALA
jgi:PTS system ascorbate-specific IIA component